MKTFKEFISEATVKPIDIDKIKDKALNKKALQIIKKKQKAFYNDDEQEVDTWNNLKKDVDSLNDLYKYTNWVPVIPLER